MSRKKPKIEIQFLDHVAIRVADIEASAAWYEEVLGLERYQFPVWGDFPIFLLCGKSGIALFPATFTDSINDRLSKNVKIDHFAFNLTKENFEKAKKKFSGLKLKFTIQDHYYFDSIYLKDPDGHTVELTTLKVEEKEYYR